MRLFIFFTFTSKNIFFNAYREIGKYYLPFLFQTSGSQEYTEEYSKGHKEQLEEFAYAVADWLRRNNPQRVIIIFKGLGSVFKKKHQTGYKIDKKRLMLLQEMSDVEIPITSIFDRSAVAFNGCKVKKKRRKKKKHLTKNEINNLQNK